MRPNDTGARQSLSIFEEIVIKALYELVTEVQRGAG
jgi:hypothetical protein